MLSNLGAALQVRFERVGAVADVNAAVSAYADAAEAATASQQHAIATFGGLAAEPVLQALGYHHPPAPGQPWPRLWWAPGDPASVPTLANVLTHLGGCTIAHFACHGLSDPADPSASRLLLHDHQDHPLTVAALVPVALDRARLAYLSCSTAFTSAAELLDEAIHLASAFQFAGFPHVIGTLWPISDALAVTIADTFYTTLTASDGALDTDRAALALHHAVRAVRDSYPATPSFWAAHLHFGA